MAILGELIGPATKLLDKFIPDASERQRIAFELSTLAERHAQEQALSQIELNKEENMTLIVVTHSLEIANLMDKVYTLHDGKLVD